MRPARISGVKHIAAVLLAALLTICVAPALAAAMPGHMADAADCMTRLCEQGTCTTTPAAVHGFPAGMIVAGPLGVPPMSVVVLEAAPEPGPAPDRPVSPLAPRSPPRA